MRVLDEKSVARGLGFSHLFNLYEGVFAVSPLLRLDLLLDSPMAVRPCQNRTRVARQRPEPMPPVMPAAIAVRSTVRVYICMQLTVSLCRPAAFVPEVGERIP